jgi:hypothetical protein
VTLLAAEETLQYERPTLSNALPSNLKPIRAEDAYAAADIELRQGTTLNCVVPARRKAASQMVEFSSTTSCSWQREPAHACSLVLKAA